VAEGNSIKKTEVNSDLNFVLPLHVVEGPDKNEINKINGGTRPRSGTTELIHDVLWEDMGSSLDMVFPERRKLTRSVKNYFLHDLSVVNFLICFNIDFIGWLLLWIFPRIGLP